MVFERQQPGQWKAGVLALLVHVLFLGLMIFSVSWQNQAPSGMQVELWSEVPAPAKVAPAPPRKPEPKPAPKPEPRPEPKPKPAPPEPKPEPKPVKADIELKAKEEEKKKRREEELKQLKEKQKLDEEKRKQEQDKKLKQEEERRKLEAQAEAENARKAELAAQQAAGQKVLDDYRGRIQAKIKRFIILPPDLAGNPQAEFDVTLMPTGDVLHLKLTRSSGSGAYDNAVERAIFKAQPLPLPPDPGQFSKFRELHLKFKPRED